MRTHRVLPPDRAHADWRWVAFTGLLVACLLGGCNAVGPDSPPASDAAKPTNEESWLCEPDSSYEDWRCERGDDLQPTRPPPPPQSESGPEIDEELLSDAIDPNEIAEAATQTLESAPGPAGPAAFLDPGTPAAGALPASARDATETPREPATPAPGRSVAALPEDLPAYIALAYTPPTPTRIVDLPEDFIAAQLIAVASKDRIQGVVDEFGMRGVAAARVESDGRLLYVLLAGIYETRELAERAVASLPPEFSEFSPWLRPLGGLQAAMRRADALAGGSDL